MYSLVDGLFYDSYLTSSSSFFLRASLTFEKANSGTLFSLKVWDTVDVKILIIFHRLSKLNFIKLYKSHSMLKPFPVHYHSFIYYKALNQSEKSEKILG